MHTYIQSKKDREVLDGMYEGKYTFTITNTNKHTYIQSKKDRKVLNGIHVCILESYIHTYIQSNKDREVLDVIYE
jgi:hypothetical protein